MTIAVDFDGTIVEHHYPDIGEEKPFAVQTLRMLTADHHRLILWSVREGKLLDDAVEWCRQRGIEFYAVNRDYPEETESGNEYYSIKLKADIFIDDKNIGGLPDWGTIYSMISHGTGWYNLLQYSAGSQTYPDMRHHRRLWWKRFFNIH